MPVASTVNEEIENITMFPADCASMTTSSSTSDPMFANPCKKLRSATNSQATPTSSVTDSASAETRKLRFSSTVNICLVLSRAELKPLMAEIFWKPEEYAKFKMDAVNELRAHLSANGISAKEAIFELYQPHEHERAQWLAQFHESEKRTEDTDAESYSTASPSVTGDEELCDLDEIYDSEEDGELHIAGDVKGLKLFSSEKTDPGLSTNNSTIPHKSNWKTPEKFPSTTNQFQWAISWKPKKLSQ